MNESRAVIKSILGVIIIIMLIPIVFPYLVLEHFLTKKERRDADIKVQVGVVE